MLKTSKQEIMHSLPRLPWTRLNGSSTCKELEEKQLTIRQTSDESGQTKDVQARMESKRQKQAEKGAAHKKIQATSLQGTTSQLKSSNRFDLLSSLPEDD